MGREDNMQRIREMGPKKLSILGLSSLIMLVIGFVASTVVTGGVGLSSSTSDLIAFSYSDASSESIPLTVDEAVVEGWEGSIRCRIGKGRFYQKAGDSGPYPVILMYNRDDQIIGIRLFSRNQQPSPPWQHEPDGFENSEVANMKFEQWITGIYLINPAKACGIITRAVCPTCYG